MILSHCSRKLPDIPGIDMSSTDKALPEKLQPQAPEEVFQGEQLLVDIFFPRNPMVKTTKMCSLSCGRRKKTAVLTNVSC